jgi:hypothetical protein
MLGCEMLKTLLHDHQTIKMVVNTQLLCMQWHVQYDAHRSVENVVFSFWNVNINFSYTNIG